MTTPYVRECKLFLCSKFLLYKYTLVSSTSNRAHTRMPRSLSLSLSCHDASFSSLKTSSSSSLATGIVVVDSAS